MWVHQTFSLFAVTFRYSHSQYRSAGLCQLFKSIHTQPLQYNLCKNIKPSLGYNLEFTRHAFRYKNRKRTDPPTDFLPFDWQRKKKFDLIEESGDRVRTLEADSALSKIDLDLSESLEDLEDHVRKQFTLETGSKGHHFEISKQLLLRRVQQHPMDFTSREVKIALKTLQLLGQLQHFKEKPRAMMGKIRLIHTINKRNQMLKELRMVDLPRFEWLVKELNIKYTPPLLHVQPVRYTRKNELRRLTKEYCEKLIEEKRTAYHAELKEQQKLFLKEKEEILAWIANEEKKLGIAKSGESSAF